MGFTDVCVLILVIIFLIMNWVKFTLLFKWIPLILFDVVSDVFDMYDNTDVITLH